MGTGFPARSSHIAADTSSSEACREKEEEEEVRLWQDMIEYWEEVLQLQGLQSVRCEDCASMQHACSVTYLSSH